MKNQFNSPVHHNEKTKTKFEQPELEQVKKHFLIKGCSAQIEAEKFFYYYESTGWYVGKKKMRSWRAAASGWILRMEQFNKDKPTPLKVIDNSGKSEQEKIAEIQQIQQAYRNQRQ